ncbi:unnamed protein product [Ceutorhynchus assimilis]|uniref:Peptidase S1 domain-containing protein n=1 Tax=Ceutorhynchus assimilis TaxID=467358 RepID=A0A9N9QPJ4_9CUCU|nr:unnamed protein product [Ceutorhynchus assimilis]
MLSVVFLLGVCSLASGSPLSLKHSPRSDLIRIVGGNDANIADYPYQVSILMYGEHSCGGSIITKDFILSAAHCFHDESRVSQFGVRVGSSLRTSGGQMFKVKKISSHPGFNYDTFDNDVAVLELASSLTFGTGVQPIQLPSASTSFVNGQNSVATGWGLTSDNGDLATILQVVTVPLITTTSCQNSYSYGSAITPRMICAGSAGKDSCTGDSGGPLVSNGVQLGIVSWGQICGAAATPGVYTKITEFLPYINNIIR